MTQVEKEKYNPHTIKLPSGKHEIISTTHNSYILREITEFKSGKNKGEVTYKDIAYGKVPHLLRRYAEEMLHENLAGKEVSLKEYVQEMQRVEATLTSIGTWRDND